MGPRPCPVSSARALPLDLLLTGRRLAAQEAYDLGLVTRIVPRPRLLAEAQEVLEEILSGDPLAVRLAKVAVQQGMEMSLPQGLDLEARLAVALFRTRRRVLPAWRLSHRNPEIEPGRGPGIPLAGRQ